MAKRKPILIWDTEDVYAIKELINRRNDRLIYPSVVPHSTLLPEWREELPKRGWVRVAGLWYNPASCRSGAEQRARSREEDRETRHPSPAFSQET
jgi:hypothetical protein